MTKVKEAPRKRPIWVWIISAFFFLSASWTSLSLYLVVTDAVPLNAGQKAYFDSLTTIDYAFTIAISVVNLGGAIALFLLRKFALYLFLSALGVNVLMAVWHGVTKGFVEALSGGGLIGVLFGYGLAIAVCIYAWKLSKRGALL